MTNHEEVAKKLREAGKELDNTFDKSDDGDEFLAAFIAIDLAIGQPKRSPFEFSPFFNRLADLIDPTCEVALDEELSQELQGDMFHCNKCNAAFPRINGEYRYCPHCGARVVRDEA